jgi:ribosomal protein S18 acetylase RimI-like enzyme
MEHVLDNPAYHALLSGNRQLALGAGTMWYFPAEVSPFVGLKDYNEPTLHQLAGILPQDRTAVTITTTQIEIPAPWKITYYGVGLQMMGDQVPEPGKMEGEVVPLQREHVPQMMALAKLTNPGPFGERTIEFGHFSGVFDHGRLIAMSGHRLQPLPYVEISGVCTHPDFAGKGLGAMMTLLQLQRIREQGNIPILHVWAHNANAIRLYEKLGFVTRRTLHFTVMQWSDQPLA